MEEPVSYLITIEYGGMFNGIDSDSAAEFTFFIPVPVMLGAGGVTPLTLGYIKIQVVLYSCIAIMRVAC